MKFPDKDFLTIHEKYGPAMEITDPNEAAAYFEKCVEHNMRTSDHTREEAEGMERHNLGYVSGYYSRETQERVEALFSAVHPVFGSVKEPVLTLGETLELGKRSAAGQKPNEARQDILSERRIQHYMTVAEGQLALRAIGKVSQVAEAEIASHLEKLWQKMSPREHERVEQALPQLLARWEAQS